MLNVALQIGVCSAEFWDITPHELGIISNVAIEKAKKEYCDLITMSWVTANYIRAKELPRLENEIKAIENGFNKKELSDSEMFKIVKNLNIVLSGNETEA